MHLPTASANHQDTAILRESEAKLIFVEDEEVTTRVIFSTGDFAGDDHTFVYDNTTVYYLTITDRSEQGIDMPPYNTRIDMPKLLKATFDSIWSATGWKESQNYDEHGNWTVDGQ